MCSLYQHLKHQHLCTGCPQSVLLNMGKISISFVLFLPNVWQEKGGAEKKNHNLIPKEMDSSGKMHWATTWLRLTDQIRTSLFLQSLQQIHLCSEHCCVLTEGGSRSLAQLSSFQPSSATKSAAERAAGLLGAAVGKERPAGQQPPSCLST